MMHRYCTDVLHLSGAEAFLRITAARASDSAKASSRPRRSPKCEGGSSRAFEDARRWTFSLERPRGVGAASHEPQLQRALGSSNPQNQGRDPGAGCRDCAEAGCGALHPEASGTTKEEWASTAERRRFGASRRRRYVKRPKYSVWKESIAWVRPRRSSKGKGRTSALRASKPELGWEVRPDQVGLPPVKAPRLVANTGLTNKIWGQAGRPTLRNRNLAKIVGKRTVWL